MSSEKKENFNKEPNSRNLKIVEDLKNLIDNKKTLLIASIKNLPASQFQEISKKLREKAIVKVPKKSLILRALDSSKKEIEGLREKIDDSVAILFSNLDSFELAGELLSNKSPAKAKPGQEAPEDIEIPAGPTDLVPGPAISELSSLGIQIQIDKGKISIKEPKIIAEKGKKISKGAADIMGKLDIKPFSIGFIPLCSFDSEEEKFYSELKIDKEGTLEELKIASNKALSFAVQREYLTQETIRILLAKANSFANKINRILTEEPEHILTEKSEEKEEIKEEKKEEPKEAASEGLASLFG